MIVRQYADIGLNRGKHPDIRGIHPVMNGLAGGVVVARRDACLQVDDPRVAARILDQIYGVSPWPGPIDRLGDRSVRLHRQIDIGTSIVDHALVQHRFSRVRQNLVDSTAEHHVAAEEQNHSVVPRQLARSLGHPSTA